jgi:signal transduction histidine kinase
MAEVRRDLSRALSRGPKQPSASLSAGIKPANCPVPLDWTGFQVESRGSYERVFGNLVAELGYAREHERQKIANDLHDHIGQNLVLAIMKLGLLKTSVAKEHVPMIREIHQLISSVIDETRSLMCDLYPHALRDLGLQAAMEWLIQRTRASYGLSCVAEMVSVPQSLPQEAAETVFQAVRELLINVAKHARAKHARVIFRGEERRVLIQVIDNGKGFEPTRLSPVNPRQGGFGLLSIRERLSRMGGSMQIQSTPGHGAKITLTLPINTEKRG